MGYFVIFSTLLDTTYPASSVTRIYVVVDNYCIHKAKAVDAMVGQSPPFCGALVTDVLSTCQPD